MGEQFRVYLSASCTDVYTRSADLVPVFSFGENDVCLKVPDKPMKWLTFVSPDL